MGAYLKLHAYFVSFFQSSPNLTKSIIFHWQCEATIIVKSVGKAPGGGGSTPTHYLYGYVPPNGVVILKLLI